MSSRLISPIWRYFTKDSLKKVTCNNQDVCKHSRPELFAEYEQSLIDESKGTSPQTIDSYLNNYNTPLNKAVASLVCKDGLSMNVINESEVLTEYFEKVHRTTINSENTVKAHMQRYARYIKSRIHFYLTNLVKDNKKVTVVVDEWKSVSNIRLLGVHLIGRPNELVCIGVIRVKGDSSSINILETVQMKLIKYKLTIDNVLAFVSDGCNTMKKIGNMINPVYHQICLQHLLQLSINGAIYSHKKLVEYEDLANLLNFEETDGENDDEEKDDDDDIS